MTSPLTATGGQRNDATELRRNHGSQIPTLRMSGRRPGTTRRPFHRYEATEDQHQIALVEWPRRWKHPECWFCAIQNENPHGGEIGGWHRNKKGRVKGAPDLYFLFRGQSLFLELKTSSGVQTPAQKVCEIGIQQARGEYIVSRSLIESLRLLYVRGILTKDPDPASY